MARKKQKTRASFGLFAFVMFFMVLLSLYMWGSVQINLIIVENDSLAAERDLITQQVNDLRMQVNQKRSYQHIAPLARKMGLIPVPAVMIDEIAVDTEAPKVPEPRRAGVQYAGVGLGIH